MDANGLWLSLLRALKIKIKREKNKGGRGGKLEVGNKVRQALD